MRLEKYLREMAVRGASDLIIATAAPVSLKLEGSVVAIENTPLQPGESREIAYELLNDKQREQFERDKELNLGFPIKGVGRFRTNVMLQRGEVTMVIRHVKNEVPAFDTLGLPPEVKDFVLRKTGLIILVGSTGCGKSTTLAAMIEHRNQNASGHILTVEDPIEYLFHHKKSIVSQREVGTDTHSYDSALREALRAAPDLIMIGEIRDRYTMENCLAYASSGHVVLSTLHATNANQAMDRIVNFFPLDQQPNLLMQLSLNLHAVISQRLVPGIDGKRLLACEVMVNTPYIAELIRKSEISKIKSLMEKGETAGMRSFDQSLVDLYEQKKIGLETALAFADSSSNLQWRLSFGAGSGESAQLKHR